MQRSLDAQLATAPSTKPSASVSKTKWALVFLVIALALGYLLLLNRAATFRYDDWNIIAHRRSWSLDALFAPLNEHWVTLTVLIFKLGFATVGIHSAFPYVGVLLVLNCAAGFELFLLIQRQSGFGPALSALVIFLLLAQGHENLFWPTQINFAGSAVFGLGAFLLIRGSDGSDRRRPALIGGCCSAH